MSCQNHKTCMTCLDWEKLQIEPWRGICKSQQSLAHNDITDACFKCRHYRSEPNEFHLSDIAE